MARRSRRPVSFGSASLLERLQAIVSEIRMTYTQATLESSDRIHGFRIRLNDALRNVERLSHLLGPCHANIVAGVEEILAMLRQLERRASERIGYLPGHRNTRKFPPVSASFKLCCLVIVLIIVLTVNFRSSSKTFSISREQLEFLVQLRFKVPQMSQLLHVSSATVKRRLRQYGLCIRQMYTQLPDARLDGLVSEITTEFPNAGYRMVRSHLEVLGYRVSQRRVRESLARVDPISVAYRWSANGNIHRR